MCIHHLSVITHEYTKFTYKYLTLVDYIFLVSTKIHDSSYSQVFSTCQKSLTCIVFLMAQHMSYMQNFSRHETLHAIFVNLDVSCTVCQTMNLAVALVNLYSLGIMLEYMCQM